MSNVLLAVGLLIFGGGAYGYAKTRHPAPLMAGLAFGGGFAAAGYLMRTPATRANGRWLGVLVGLVLAAVQGYRSMQYDPPSQLGLAIASTGFATAVYLFILVS